MVETAGLRRLMALVAGLPPEAATWRSVALPPVEEFLARLLEQQDEWSRALLQAALRHKRIYVPSPVRIVRPGDPEPEQRRIETDPRRIAAWFAKHVQS